MPPSLPGTRLQGTAKPWSEQPVHSCSLGIKDKHTNKKVGTLLKWLKTRFFCKKGEPRLRVPGCGQRQQQAALSGREWQGAKRSRTTPKRPGEAGVPKRAPQKEKQQQPKRKTNQPTKQQFTRSCVFLCLYICHESQLEGPGRGPLSHHGEPQG